MEQTPYSPPDDDALAEAQKRLNFNFPPSYVQFIKSGYSLGDSILEPLMIDPVSSHLDIYDSAKNAWENYKIPREWLPICEDNGDLYLIDAVGTVHFWSHDGMFPEENWSSLESWIASLAGG